MLNSEKIQKRMSELGIRQKTMAKEMGMAQSTLSLKIRGRRPFFLDEAEMMARILHISDSEFALYFFSHDVA